MKSHARYPLVLGLLAVAAALLPVGQAAALDEIVVYGTPPAIAFETKVVRVEVGDYLKSVNASLRSTVAETFRKTPRRIVVASAAERTRG